MTRVSLEVGKTWVFATAVDWPGWCRRGKGEIEALEELMVYADRYRPVAGRGFKSDELEVIGQVKGNSTTDFGAPNADGPWDGEALEALEAKRMGAILSRSWAEFDRVVVAAPATLRKGPKGGGRDTAAIVDHVREAERGYAPKIGVRVPPRTPWSEQRATILERLETGKLAGIWSPRRAFLRITWHILDHAWEIEDKAD